MQVLRRRSIVVGLPQAACAGLVALATVRVTASCNEEPPKQSAPRAVKGSDTPPETAVSGREVTSGRAQPLPVPLEADPWWQEWLDLVSMTSRKGDGGC